jgi:hypothetical protein
MFSPRFSRARPMSPSSPQVDPCRADLARKSHVVIDDQKRAAAAAHAGEHRRLFAPQRWRCGFISILDGLRTSGDRGFDLCYQHRDFDDIGRNRVQAAQLPGPARGRMRLHHRRQRRLNGRRARRRRARRGRIVRDSLPRAQNNRSGKYWPILDDRLSAACAT